MKGVKMITSILCGFFAVFCVVCLIITIVFNIVHFGCKSKCITKRYNEYTNTCSDDDCLWNFFCDYYEHIYTEEEIARLEQMIEDFKKRTEKTP